MGNPSRHTIICDLLGLNLTEAEFKSKYDECGAFFKDWYDEQCDAMGVLPVSLEGDFSLLRSVISEPRHKVLDEYLTQRSSIVYSNDHSTKPEQYLPHLDSDVSREKTNAQVALLARVWSMVSLDAPKYSLFLGQSTCWPSESSLLETIKDAFEPGPEPPENTTFPVGLTLANLELIAGIQVVWTSNFTDHLKLTCEDTKVMVFHQLSFLELHKRSNVQIYPPGLIDETFRTLALLIPSTSQRSKRWFQRKRKHLHLDPNAGTYGPLNAAKRHSRSFHYWQDRLILLKQTFEDSEPHDVMSWWYDDRKKVQWYTFWVAFLVLILTIFFGLLQTIAGFVQAWAAVKSMPNSP